MTLRKVGRYELVEEIGKGGMATVFRAFDPRFKREVAVKVLDQGLLHDPSLKARFEREAQTIAALEHPAIVPVYDFGEEHGHLYLVMRLMLGGSLAGRIAQGPLPLADVLQILQRIGAALDRAHQKGVIHRDLKPGNIMFDEYGDAYLGDFGIARLTESTVTLTGDNIIGTPAYMSPEQIHGDKALDSRSDIYALGVICFEMLTGQRPYMDSSPSRVMMRHVMDPIPDIRQLKPDLPPRVEGVITHSMAKQPAERFATAAELTDTFEGVLRQAAVPGAAPVEAVTEPAAAPQPVDRIGADRPETPPAATEIEPQPELPPQTEVAVPSFAQAPTPAAASRPRWRLPLLLGGGGILIIALVVAGIFYAVNQLRSPAETSPTEPVATQIPAFTPVAASQEEAESAAQLPTADEGDAPGDPVGEYQARFSEHFEAGEYLQALSVANEAIEQMPAFAWWYHERASAQWALGLAAEALVSNATGLEVDADSGSLHSQRARFLAATGATAAALELHTKAIELEPANGYLYLEMSLTLREIGQYDEALDYLGQAIEREPTSDYFYGERAVTYRQMGRLDEALADLAKAVELNPEVAWYYDQFAEIQIYEVGDIAAALEYYERAIELAPQESWRFNAVAILLRDHGRADEALGFHEQAIALAPQDASLYVERAETWRNYLDNPDAALADMNMAIELAPHQAEYRAIRGQIFQWHLGDLESAIADYDRALELDSSISWALDSRARLYRERGELESALADHDGAILLEPDNAAYYMERGYTYLWLGDQALRALADFNSGLEVDGSFAPLYQARAQAYANWLDQPEAARSDLDRCVELDPEFPWCYLDRAWLYDSLAETDQAVADFEAFLAVVPPEECPNCVEDAERYLVEHGG